MVKYLIKKILGKPIKISPEFGRKPSGITYWQQRARQYGQRAVFHLGHSEAEIEAVTHLQKEKIFPALKKSLKGNETLLLDFGCGTGRFTSDLAAIIQGRAIGVDPVELLIDLAPRTENVEYRLIKTNTVPIEDDLVDVVWVCLVLGGIIENNLLDKAVNEINRVLKKNGLLFLIENTSEKNNTAYWKFRSVQEYQKLFSFVNLQHVSDYFDMEERISIMAGYKGV